MSPMLSESQCWQAVKLVKLSSMQEFSLSPGEGAAGEVQGEEVTAEQLLLHEEEGRAAIVQVTLRLPH